MLTRLKYDTTATALVFLCLASNAFAADPPQSPRPHSLIHRQTPEASAVLAPTTAGTAGGSTPTTRSPQRKLTKRPIQTSVAPTSNGTTTSPATAPSSQPTATTPTGKTGIASASTGLAALGTALLSSTSPTNGAASGSSTGLSSSVGKPPVAGALAGIDTATPPSSTSSSRGRRGLQRLSTQVPGVMQLITPTVTVSSAPPASAPSPVPSPTPTPSPVPTPAPSPVTTQPPPSSPPPATQLTPTPPPPSGTATLSWALDSASDVGGYRIYVGTAPGVYNYPGSPFVVGLVANYTIMGLPAGQTYYFAISAFNTGGESVLSAEVSKSIY